MLHRLHRRSRRRAVPLANNHEKINSWENFPFLYEYGAQLGGTSGHQSSAMCGYKLIWRFSSELFDQLKSAP